MLKLGYSAINNCRAELIDVFLRVELLNEGFLGILLKALFLPLLLKFLLKIFKLISWLDDKSTIEIYTVYKNYWDCYKVTVTFLNRCAY